MNHENINHADLKLFREKFRPLYAAVKGSGFCRRFAAKKYRHSVQVLTIGREIAARDEQLKKEDAAFHALGEKALLFHDVGRFMEVYEMYRNNAFADHGSWFSKRCDHGLLSYEMMKKGVMDEIKNIFKPEFLNRIDDIIVFHPLEKEEITRIVRLLTDVMAKRVKENMNITVSFTKKAIEKIAEEGYDKAYGARPLRRAIQSKIEDAFAEEYLLGNIKAGDKVSVGLKTNGFSFRVVK